MALGAGEQLVTQLRGRSIKQTLGPGLPCCGLAPPPSACFCAPSPRGEGAPLRPLSWPLPVPAALGAPRGCGAPAVFSAVLSSLLLALPPVSPSNPAGSVIPGTVILGSSQASLSSRAASPCPQSPRPSRVLSLHVGARLPGSHWAGRPPGADSQRLARRRGGGGCGEKSWRPRPHGWAGKQTLHCPVCCPQGAQAHGCAWHTGGGSRSCRAEGGCAGTAVLAGWGLRAGPQGLPLRAAVLRRWVRAAGGWWCGGGAPASVSLSSPLGAAQPKCSPTRRLSSGNTWGGRRSEVPSAPLFPLEKGKGEVGGAAWAWASASGHQAVGSGAREGRGRSWGRGCRPSASRLS